jgi:amidase
MTGAELRIGREAPRRYEYEVPGDEVEHVEPGGRVVVQTWDARAGAVSGVPAGTSFDFPIRHTGARSNPLSGPIAVRGAVPGDAVVVSIEDISVVEEGWCGGRPIAGLDALRISRPLARICSITDGRIAFSETISIPMAPMIGCIGTASEDGSQPSEHPGRTGGNMDHNVIRVGARVYLPVRHRGAYLYLGDVHAVQGDGELSGVGLEISAEVTATVDLLKDCAIEWPWAEFEDRIMVLTSGPNFPAARRAAMEAILDAVETQLELEPAEALALVSLVGDIRIGQACGGMDITVRLEMPSYLGLRPS